LKSKPRTLIEIEINNYLDNWNITALKYKLSFLLLIALLVLCILHRM